MTTYFAQGRVDSARKEIETARKRQADFEKKAATGDAAAGKARADAAKTSSDSTRKSKMRSADSEATKANNCRRDAARESEKVASATAKLHKAEAELAKEREREQKKADDRVEKARLRADRDREAEDRRRAQRDAARDREVQRLRQHTSELEAHLAARPWAVAPDEIRVLFVAASPEDEQPLRLDKEVREIQKRMRETEHRDSVVFEYRLATQTSDLMQALNEVRPHVVHFSGHGSQDALILEDSDGRAKPLYIEDLAQLLRITSDRIRLAIFNSCHSADAARAGCDFVPFTIGMNQPVNDTFAQVFAGQLYNSIGFGRSLQQAFDQALWQAKDVFGGSSGDPILHAADGEDPATTYLVKPPV
jgi:CHAT domain